MKRADMVRNGAAQLLVAEEALERALMETAALGSLLGRLRIEGGLSAVIGQDAFEEISDTIAGLTKARRSMVNTHAHLNDVRVQIGCRTVAIGAEDCPDPPSAQITGANQFSTSGAGMSDNIRRIA